MTDYDATAHISEGKFSCSTGPRRTLTVAAEVKRAAIAAPVAIFVAVIGTGLLGWILNIVLVLCSGGEDVLTTTLLTTPSDYAVVNILYTQMGKGPTYLALVFITLTAGFVVITAVRRPWLSSEGIAHRPLRSCKPTAAPSLPSRATAASPIMASFRSWRPTRLLCVRPGSSSSSPSRWVSLSGPF